MDEQRNEILVTDMKSVFEPQSALSSVGDTAHWRVVEYTGKLFAGSMLTALDGAYPEDVTYSPGLHGVYKISVLILSAVGCNIYLGMSGDKGPDLIKPTFRTGYAKTVEEIYWRTEKMDGRTITLTKRPTVDGEFTYLVGFRFTPVSDAEAAELEKERQRRDTKRLYASNDIHNLFYFRRLRDIGDIVSVLRPLAESDTEWFSFEDIRCICHGDTPVPPDEFAFVRAGDKRVEKQVKMFDFDKMQTAICDEARKLGIKSCVSFRMGAWGMQFPYNKCYFDVGFSKQHPEWCCVTRDGEPTDFMSYAYPGVRRYFIDRILQGASCGADAVCLIEHRAPPFVLFEKPVADRFYEKFGYYPNRLPLDNPDINSIHCEIMAEYFAELRKALDDKFGKGRIQIHLRTSASVIDSKIVGLDCEALASKGLVDAVITYPHRQCELIDEAVFDDDGLINLEKYTASIKKGRTTKIENWGEFGPDGFREPYPDGRGGFIGPASLKEATEEWVALSKRTGVPVYFDIMPRVMTNEKFDERIEQIESYGATHFAMWDSYERIAVLTYWNHIKLCCHAKDDGRHRFDAGYDTYHLIRNDGINVERYLPMWGG